MNCPEITMQDVCAIFYKIIACMPEEMLNECQRVNTFAYLMDMADLNAENAVMWAKNARKGEYFNRRWEMQGQPMTTNSIFTNYPALLLDNVTGTYEDITNSGWLTYPLILSVWDKYEPDGNSANECPECIDRTRKEVERDTEKALEWILREFKEFIGS